MNIFLALAIATIWLLAVAFCIALVAGAERAHRAQRAESNTEKETTK